MDPAESALARERGERRRPRARWGPAAFRETAAALASLKLTVVLLGLALFLTFAGTLAQVDRGIWTVMEQYFRTPVARIQLRVFFPRGWDVPGTIWFPGGWLIGGLLFVNLVAAHATRFAVAVKGARAIAGYGVLAAGSALTLLLCLDLLGVQPGGLSSISVGWGVLFGVVLVMAAGAWLLFGRRAGIVLSHGGIAVLLLSELITGVTAVEGQMVLREGETSNVVESPRLPELAVIDRSPAEYDEELVVPWSRLRKGGIVRDPALPFDIEVRDLLVNSELVVAPPGAANPAESGDGAGLLAVRRPEVGGVSSGGEEDVPSAVLGLRDKRNGASLGTWLVSYWFEPGFAGEDRPQRVVVDGRTYDLYLRSRRAYRPYTFTLLDFRHDVYPGTQIPKDFSSFVRVRDEKARVDREVRIWMNHPLRYAGETFYQASFLPGDSGTVLQVVSNPAWAIPYVSCLMVAVGLLAHFGSNLGRFLRRRAT